MDSEKMDFLYSKSGAKEEDEILLRPVAYTFNFHDNKIGSSIVSALNFWFKIPSEKMQVVDNIIQLFCSSTFIIDDIQDNSDLRNGFPVAHSVHGISSSINAASYLSCIYLENVLSLNHPQATQVYVEEMLKFHRGQGLDIYWRENCICPTEEEYRNMTIKKTGPYLNILIRLMQLFSDCEEDFTTLAGIMHVYFQIRNDYINLTLPEYIEKKGYCDDISEGKFSFPIIHAIQNHPEDDQVLNILRQRTKNVEVKKYCVNLLEKYGSFKYTRNVLAELNKKARKEVERLGGNPYLIAVLDEIFTLN